MEKNIILDYSESQKILFDGDNVKFYNFVKNGNLDHDLSSDPEDSEKRAYLEGYERVQANLISEKELSNNSNVSREIYEKDFSNKDIAYVSKLAEAYIIKFPEEITCDRVPKKRYLSTLVEVKKYAEKNNLTNNEIHTYLGEKIPTTKYKSGFYYFYFKRVRKHLEDLMKNDSRFDITKENLNTTNECLEYIK